MSISVDQLCEIIQKDLSLNANIYIEAIVKIQSIIRMYLIKRWVLIPSSYYQTKIWRKSRDWYNGGKSNECEKYQIDKIQSITRLKLVKTFKRMNLESFEIVDKKYPLKDTNGFEYTETFDGVQIIDNEFFYYNLKFVCDNGGSQTRSLREVYHFIKTQLEYLVINKNSKIYFINILDGNTSYEAFNKYNYLKNKPQYIEIKKYVFIGDLAQFQLYWRSRSI